MRTTQFYDNLSMEQYIHHLPEAITPEILERLAAAHDVNPNDINFIELTLTPSQWAVWWPNRDGSVRVTSFPTELAAQEELEGRRLTEILGG
jgi:hypothetical protein